MSTMTGRAWVLLLIGAAVSGCSNNPMVCVAGSTLPCSCSNGRMGTQSCNISGTNYDVCLCAANVDAGTDALDAVTPIDANTPDDGAIPPDASSYNATVLSDLPVAFWNVDHPIGSEPDLTGHGHAGTYHGGTPALVAMPNGDQAADFNGSSEYLSIPSSASFSIPTTGELTWEGWIRPDVLQYPNSTGGYVDWMGKCESYSPTCEWESRMYNTTNSQSRCNRFSAYAFNPTAGLGSGADFQPTCGLIQSGHWYHVVGEYTTRTQPADCPNAPAYPGALNIWVNGVEWNQANHNPTGCMSQYSVVPVANNSALNIGTMALDSWFQGAIGKVAIYDHLLTSAQITRHYTAMTGQTPTGSCAAECTF